MAIQIQKIADDFISIGNTRIRISAITSYSFNVAQPKSRYLTIVAGSQKHEILLESTEVQTAVSFLDRVFGARRLGDEFLD